MKKSKLIQLVLAMQQGDEQAYNEIYNEFYYPMLHMAMELTHNDADAKDVVQTTFIQIHHSVKDLKEPAVFVLWMKRILANKCQKLYRARKNTIYNDDVVEAQLFEESSHEDHAKKAFRFEQGKQELHQLVGKLDYIHREVIVLYYFDQLKIKEVAKVLGISEGTVKSRLNTAKVTLRKLCKEYEQEHNERISMHIGGIGLSLIGMYSMKSHMTKMHQLKFKAQAVHVAVGTPAIVIAGTVCGSAALALPSFIQPKSEEQIHLQEVKENQTGLTNQEAYFELKSWAHCKDEMKERDAASYERIYPYFLQLKEHGGTYWEALQADTWADDFVKFMP